MKKILILFTLSALLLSCLTACTPQAQVFSFEGIAIRLDSSFSELESDDDTVHWVSYQKMYSVSVSFETAADLTALGNPEDMTVEAYAQTMLEADDPEATLRSEKGLVYYSYPRKDGDLEMTTLVTFHFLGETYWTIRFSCESAAYESAEAQFLAWAGTVDYIPVTETTTA